jgi:hypothetical protein
MKRTRCLNLICVALLLAAASSGPLLAATAPKAKGKAAGKNQPAGLKFRVQQLHVDNNEGCAVADFNKDGHLDISAGDFWYPGPRFTEKIPLRKLEPFGKDYLTNCGEHAYDVNGDGWIDVVSGAFMDTKISWYQNPGAAGLKGPGLWQQHVLVDTKLGQNEWSEMRDFDGDGIPEYVVNSYGENNPMMVYKFARGEKNEPICKPWTIHEGGPAMNGHGIGFGDLNGDGHEDILYGNGWYERPKQGAASKSWIQHPDWRLPHASTPMIWWEERRDDNKDGSTNWRHHLIDDRFSQAHALVWEDIDQDGQPELITGRRVKAHSGNDPGDSDPGCLYYFKWNAETKKFTKFTIVNDGPGIGLQIRLADLDGNGWKDIVVAGKSGTHVLWNLGK